jgi:multicomponent Na+:H+ antiporter subunit A
MIEYLLLIIFLSGLGCLLIPVREKTPLKTLAFTAGVIALVWGIISFFFSAPITFFSGLFLYRPFSGLFGLAVGFYCFITIFFSLKYADFIERLNQYYAFILWNVCFTLATIYTTDLIALLVFWGLSGLTLYLLAGLLPGAANTAKKSFIFIGGSDALMILGVALYSLLAGSSAIYSSRLEISAHPLMATASFLCLLVAALAKAGAMPFHTWVPDFADDVPLTINALLPASLDKLQGIFLLLLLVQQLFVINTAMALVLLVIGGTTLLLSAFMALVQTDARRLLGYSTISQVGYMLLAVSCGTSLGMAAAVFHVLNHTLYKSGLFLTTASIDHRMGTSAFGGLGGLSRYLPITFVCCLIFSLAIAGIPPLNGFASKWLIYQALFQKFTLTDTGLLMKSIWLLFMVVAMFGSAITLASFVKLLHSMFLGQPSVVYEKKPAEVHSSMLVPVILLAVICILFGFFPTAIPLDQLVLPGLKSFGLTLPALPAFYTPGAATALVILGIFIGLLIAVATGLGKKMRTDEPFIGGEEMPVNARAAGSDFYRTISDFGPFRALYARAERKVFDLYTAGTKTVVAAGGLLSSFHSGSLHLYLLFLLAGFAALFIVFLR